MKQRVAHHAREISYAIGGWRMEESQRLKDRGGALFRRGRFAEAERVFGAAIHALLPAEVRSVCITAFQFIAFHSLDGVARSPSIQY